MAMTTMRQTRWRRQSKNAAYVTTGNPALRAQSIATSVARFAIASTSLAARRGVRNAIAEMTPEPHWYLTKDGDVSCLELYERHYSCYRYADGRKRSQFVGPGETIVLRTGDADAMFVWRKFIDDSGQQGVNCAVFRNEGQVLSSELVRQADAVADHVWPGERHYTYVDPKAVKSTNPGYCFVAAGWRRCGVTKSGLLIFERTGDDA